MTATPETPKRPELRPFGIANYRSFDNDGFFLDKVGQVNVFIGKNNSGKSNVLNAIRILGKSRRSPLGAAFNSVIDSHRGQSIGPSASILINDTDITSKFNISDYLRPFGRTIDPMRWLMGNRELESKHPFQGLPYHILRQVTEHLMDTEFVEGPSIESCLEKIQQALIGGCYKTLKQLENLIYIPNFREIRNDGGTDAATGQTLIPLLHDMQVPEPGSEVERVKFDRIQGFVRDLLNDQSVKIEVPSKKDKIIIQMHGNRLPLSCFGTGVHQLVILCIALALHDGCVVCIEEPEIHMHPELQRKFIRFLKTTNNTYFITTHSNVFMDFLDDATIYHVTYDGIKSTVKRLEADSHARDILTDMGYKASDLLQANGIIWVEGPSDRIYLNKWISLLDESLIEGVHYAIAFYGGKVLAHFSASDDPVGEFVRILKINRNAACVIDRDGNDESAVLSTHKTRVHEEMKDGFCWITDGREIENYLRPELVTEYLEKAVGHKVKFNFGVNDKLEKQIKTALKTDDKKIDYAREKPAYARRFVESMTIADLDAPNLRPNVERLVKEIRKWNNLPE